MSKNKFVRNLTLAKDIVVLDGLSGTGKSMFTPILASMKKMQNPRFEYMFEYLLLAANHSKISEDAANCFLKLLADIKLYDGCISRDVNFRPSDISGVIANKNGFKYIKQLFNQDGLEAQTKIAIESPRLLLITHQILSCFHILDNCFGENVKVVEIVRHPLYLIDHWLSYIDMYCSNPRDFTVWVQTNENLNVPWFAEACAPKFIEMSRIEKIIYSIDTLMKPVYNSFDRSPGNLMFIPFEDFVLKPVPHIQRLSHFLGTSTSSATKAILKEQNIPRHFVNKGPVNKTSIRYNYAGAVIGQTDKDDYDAKWLDFKDKYGHSNFKKLQAMSDNYHHHFGIWF